MGTTLPAHFARHLPNFKLSTFNFSFSVFFSIAILEHIAQHLDGKSSFFNFEILAEVEKPQLPVVVTDIADFIQRVEHVVPVDGAGERRFVLVGERVVVA